MPGFETATGDAGFHRARQFDPAKCTGTPKTIDITGGVKAVICKTGGESTSVQTYLFDKDKFSPAEAKAWLEKHKKKALSIEFEDGEIDRVILAKIKTTEIEEALVEKLFHFDQQKLDIFIPFKKIDAENRQVLAYLTTGDLDHDGQRVDMQAIARALPEWLEWGNIREMHEKKVAGVVQSNNAKIDDYGLLAKIDVLREDTWKLIEGGGYKGVSIGIGGDGWQVKKSPDAPRGLITDGRDGKNFQIIEASFVDRPANPNCKILSLKQLAENKEIRNALSGEVKVEKDAGDKVAETQIPDETKKDAIPEIKKQDVGTDNVGVVTYPSFATDWAGQELSEDLPDMLDTLYSVIRQIAWSQGTVDEKKAAMQQAVGEFADMCGQYMTGEKLAKALILKIEKTDSNKDKIEKELKQDWLKLVGALFSDQFETLKTDFDGKLKEAVSTIEKLQSEKTELEKRVKTIEETPLPAKAIGNAELMVNPKAALGGGQPKTFEELLAIKNKLAKSNDPEARRAADQMGTLMFRDEYGGK